jgi:hypothetical protein
MWTGLIWFWIGSNGGVWTRQWTFGFHKRWRISWPAERLLVSQEGLCSMKLVHWYFLTPCSNLCYPVHLFPKHCVHLDTLRMAANILMMSQPLHADVCRVVRIAMYEGWSKISGTEFIVGKRKHLQVTRSYLLQSTTLQIVCSDSSDPSTFQCMSGRLVLEWP